LVAGRLVRRGIWWWWLLACFVFLLDLVGAAAVLGHAAWASLVRLACAVLLLPLGLLVARDWLDARETVLTRLVRTEDRSRHIARAHRHLVNLLLVVLGIAWIGIGTLNLAQGLSNIA
jgi:hypothetical protein